MKLGLGTVQFGQAYGITNARGVTPQAEAHAVIRRAAEAGVLVLDTAPRYGDAERVLGSLGPQLADLRIVTKTPDYAGVPDAGAHASASFDASLKTLGLERVHGWLEHRVEALLGPDGDAIWRALSDARDAGRVARIGASVYTTAQLDGLLERYPIDLVQLPANVLDRRQLDPERLARLRGAGIEVHARSALLQGALLGDPAAMPQIPGLGPLVGTFQRICADAGCSPLAGALGFLQSIPEIDVVLLGVEDTTQLNQALEAAAIPLDPTLFDGLACDDPLIVDPSQWKART
tara:strand:- start:1530 stop:2402 length:873 start_codon:yes stop_codon:yes gene_type:complete